MIRTVLRVTAMCVAGLTAHAVDAPAQSHATILRSVQQQASVGTLRTPALPALERAGGATRPTAVRSPTPAASQQTAPRTCRRGRRALIGALIGAGGSIPVAVLAHERWENEAANGAGAAATMLALGAAAGALIGLATCS
jgi:hypothetical protein